MTPFAETTPRKKTTQFHPQAAKGPAALNDRTRILEDLLIPVLLDDRASYALCSLARADAPGLRRMLEIELGLRAQSPTIRQLDRLSLRVAFSSLDGADWEYLLAHARDTYAQASLELEGALRDHFRGRPIHAANALKTEATTLFPELADGTFGPHGLSRHDFDWQEILRRLEGASAPLLQETAP